MENKLIKISDLKPLTYGMIINNIDMLKKINKKSSFTYLNLENLVSKFKLNGSFISKSYYQTDPEFAYNDPPKGPIPNGFECLYCHQEGPSYHLQSCIQPFDDLLVLAESGIALYPEHIVGESYIDIILKRGQKKIVSSSIRSGKFTNNVVLIVL